MCFDYLDSFDVAVLQCLHRDDCMTRMESYPFIRVIQLIFPCPESVVLRHYMGGDCLNTGCVPSKALIAAAKTAAAVPPEDANANFQAAGGLIMSLSG